MEAYQVSTGTIIVKESARNASNLTTTIYARVSSNDQKADLERQAERLSKYAIDHDLSVIKTVRDVGSGLNGKRPKLKKLLADPSISIILVEHQDRLTRFAFEYLQAALSASDKRIMVIEDKEVEDDPVVNMIDILTSYCARLYGKRSANNKARAVIKGLT